MSMSWDDFPGPRHDDEMATRHQGAPSIAEQDRTHGAGLPAVDNGTDDHLKYDGSM